MAFLGRKRKVKWDWAHYKAVKKASWTLSVVQVSEHYQRMAFCEGLTPY